MDRRKLWRFARPTLSAQTVARKLPDCPPCFSSNRTSVIVIARSTALHMS